MAEPTEKSKACEKAFHIWRYGIYGSCLGKECNYEPMTTAQELEARKDVVSDE